MLDLLRALLGLPILAVLLYVPGATLIHSLARRSGSPLIFSGADEWLFTAVLVSVLVTGGGGLLLGQLGFFHWWALLPLVLLFSLAVALMLGGIPLGWRSFPALLKPPAPYPQRREDRRQARLQRFALLGVILVAVGLFSRPAEMLRGGLDSGVYVNAGVALGRTGAILQRDPLMRQLNDDRGEGNELLLGQSLYRYTLDRLRLSGFYVLDKKAALVLPQHYSLYPVWIGLLYSLFGVWGALYATPLLALLFVLAIYYFARRALSPSAALVALPLLVLCPVVIWFARYPVSEVLTGLLAFGAFYAFLRMTQGERRVPTKDEGRRTKDEGQPTSSDTRHSALSTQHSSLSTQHSALSTHASFWGALAGVSLGQISLARPDFIFYLAPVPAFLLYWRLTRRWRPAYSWFAGSLAAVLGLYFIHFTFFGFAYTMDLYHNVIQDVRRLWGPLLLALYVGVFALIALDRLYPRLRPFWLRLEGWTVRWRWVWAGALALLVGGFALYHYAIGPWLPNLRLDKAGNPIAQAVALTWESYIGAPVDQGGRYNLLRIGWYLSPLGIVAGAVGFLRLIWNRLNAGTALFVACVLLVGYAYIPESYTEAHYIYTMRRYLPLILPALILGVAWLCQLLWSRLKPRPLGAGVAAALALLIAVFFIYTGRAIMGHVEEEGAVAQFSDLASRFPEKSVVIFSNERDEPNVVATPLQYVYGIESFVANRSYPNINSLVLEGVVKRWQEQGYSVWVMMSANGGKLHFPNMTLREAGRWEYDVPEFEQLYYQKPFNVSEAYLPWGIYSVQQGAPSSTLPSEVDIGEMDYPALVGGFHRQERDKSGAPYWRWIGEQAILRVPWPQEAGSNALGGATLKLTLRPETPIVGQEIRRAEPLTVTLHLDDTPIGTVVVPPGSPFTEYQITVPPGTPKGRSEPGYAHLLIRSPTWSGQRAGLSYDTRTLGVQIDMVRVTSDE